MRPISVADFDRITERGLAGQRASLPRLDAPAADPGMREEQAAFQYERERVAYLNSRLVRDRVFRRIVLRAYDARCAITSLKLINGGGRAEAEAAHIRPVEAGGPDIVGNGLALSGTAHWMFDRGLIGIADDYGILVSRQVNDAEGVRGMINRTGRILVPDRAADRPHPQFLRWHREPAQVRRGMPYRTIDALSHNKRVNAGRAEPLESPRSIAIAGDFPHGGC